MVLNNGSLEELKEGYIDRGIEVISKELIMLFLQVNGLIHLVDYQVQLFRANILFRESLRKRNEALGYKSRL